MAEEKVERFYDWFLRVLEEGEFIDQRYPVKGFIVHRPNAAIIEKHVYDMIEGELEKEGHKRSMFPSVVLKSFFEKEAEHAEGFAPEVFWLEPIKGESEERLALRPTSETIMYYMYALWVRSYRDLPMKLYQSCQIWRLDTKATKALLRDREFYWIEAHDVFRTPGEAEEQVLTDERIMQKTVWERLGIPFVFLKRPEWDKFPGGEATYAFETLAPDGRALQFGTTHNLGQKFSKSFEIQYLDEDGEKKMPYQTCFGPGVSRILACLIAVHGDDKGAVLPFEVAPVQVVVVPVLFKDNMKEKVMEKARELHKTLSKDYRVVLDDSDKTPGNKYYHWELRGVPIRIEVGPRDVEAGKVTLVPRDTGEKKQVPEENVLDAVKEEAAAMLERMKEKAKKDFESRVAEASSMEELGKKLDEVRGFVKVPFCDVESFDGLACADEIGERFKAFVRGVPAHNPEKPPEGARCIVCGKPAKHIVWVSRSY